MIDLHTHTIHSDGTTTPERNVELAVRAGLDGLALTDHDTLAGWERCAQACAEAGIAFVPGVELSTEWGGLGVHLLGYWVDEHNQALRTECERLRGERQRRAGETIARLADAGVYITESAVAHKAGGAPIGRPHIAAAMVDVGAVPDIDTAFAEYLADGMPAYVPKRALNPVQGVELLRAAGGVAVLAHPGMSQPTVTAELVDQLAEAGLVGIEAEHAGHDAEQIQYWRTVAGERGLEVTGSSDFHGERKDLRIGERRTPRAVVDRLRAHCLEVRPV